jgi:hypothetical protein
MSIWQQLTSHIAANAAAYITASLALSTASVVVSFFLFLGIRRLYRPLSIIRRAGDDAGSIVTGVAASVENIEATMSRLEDEFRTHVEASRSFVRHVGLLRYDAFTEVGGNQSFSLCLLDDNRSGVILTYLTGKNFTRSYVVTVTDGTPSRELGEEEMSALNQAVSVATI